MKPEEDMPRKAWDRARKWRKRRNKDMVIRGKSVFVIQKIIEKRAKG